MTTYINVTNTALSMTKTGIQRVVRELASQLWSQGDIQFICWWKDSFRLLEQQDLENLLKAKSISPKKDIRIDSLQKGDIFLDIDASWGDEYCARTLFQKLKKNGITLAKLHYDAVPILFPHFSHENTVFAYSENFSAGLQYADYWLCISKTVERDLIAIAEKIGAGTPTTKVIELGSDFEIKEAKPVKTKRKRPYILVVGTVEPRKNHQLLIEAMDLLIAQSVDVDLVIVGKQGWKTEQLQKRIEKHRHFKKRIHWLKSASDETVTALYKEAFACINTSHYEGYGLPVIESLSHNCVTICSENSAMEEVAKGAAYIITPTPEDVANTIIDLQKPDVHAHYKQLAINFCAPTWSHSAEQLHSLLKNISLLKDFSAPPTQAVYISIRPEALSKSLESVVENMPFIQEVIVLTPSRHADSIARSTHHIDLDIKIIEEENIGLTELPDDHLIRNSLLRKTLYSHDSIAANFIAFDDDYRVVKTCNVDDFIVDGKHKAHYFFNDARDWLGAFPTPTSFDQGLWRTAKFLQSSGYDCKLYNAHMPQIINKELSQKILNRSSNIGVDEWSVYFNIAKHQHPDLFIDAPYRTTGWPPNFDSWLPASPPEKVIFENHDHESSETIDSRLYLEQLDEAVRKRAEISPDTLEVSYRDGELSFSADKIIAPKEAKLFIKLNIEDFEYTFSCSFAGRFEYYDHQNLPRFLFIPCSVFETNTGEAIEMSTIDIEINGTQGKATKSIPVLIHNR